MKFTEFLSEEKTKRDGTSKNAPSFISVSFMDPLMIAMNEKESTDLDIQVDKSRINSDSKKAPNYISINVYCRKCTNKYIITVKNITQLKMNSMNLRLKNQLSMIKQHMIPRNLL